MIKVGMFNRHEFGRSHWNDKDASERHKNLTHVIRRTSEYTYFENENIVFELHSTNNWRENREYFGWHWHPFKGTTLQISTKRRTWSLNSRLKSFENNDIYDFLVEE